jgi:hypothetical protein
LNEEQNTAAMLMNTQQFYRLKRSEPPWGDYGDILFHGMAARAKQGELELERTGPFMPPITQPGSYVIVTTAFLQQLGESGLKGFEAGPVTKKRIPMLDWRAWAPFGTQEMKYPAGGEPENYLLRRKHAPEAADALGELWELRFRPAIDISREGGYHLVLSSWDGSDFVVGREERPIYNYVSARARDWLMQNAPEWVAFEKVRAE